MVEATDLNSYCVVACDDKYEVRAPSGRIIMVCTDEASAAHYAVLLTEAFAVGYKAGFREGRADTEV